MNRRQIIWMLWPVLLAVAGKACGQQQAVPEPSNMESDTSTRFDEVRVVRLANNPIIRPEMLSGDEGENINGPSLIRVPDWVQHPLGRYYLYFAHHGGKYIRMAYADHLTGPWTVYEPGTLRLEQAPMCTGHIASPDVLIDSQRRQFRMYFHGPPVGRAGQESFVALSNNGLNFEARPESLGLFYFRVFRWDGAWYAMAKGGLLYRSVDGLHDFQRGHNPLSGGATRDAMANNPGPRHVALHLTGSRLWVYYTSIGDRPERVLRCAIALNNDWSRWTAGPPQEVLRPEQPWEGADLPLTVSRAGPIKAPENALRDPAIFVDDDGRTYLLYCVAGECGIAIAELVSLPNTEPAWRGRLHVIFGDVSQRPFAPRRYSMHRSSIMMICLLAATPSLALAGDYYVDQRHANASDENPGTEAKPLATLKTACAKAMAGDTVYVKAGVYREYLAPRHTGAANAPLTFQAIGEVVVKGSDIVSDWQRDGEDWIKRPWRNRLYWSEDFLRVSEDRFKAAARQEQVFIDGQPLLWVPEASKLEPGSFYWAEDGSEIRLRLEEGVDPNKVLIEVPRREATLCAWPGTDVRSLGDYERLKRDKPQSVAKLPLIDHLVVRGFTFCHNVSTINRGGVRIQGKHWTLEDNIIEWMNTVGVATGGAHVIMRRNIVRFNGQLGFGGGGSDVLMEDNASLWNNVRYFRTGWGGSADKLAYTKDYIIRRHVTLGGGSGLWFDIDCQKTLIEDCVILPNHLGPAGGAHGGIFYEISYEGNIRNNVVFGNIMSTGRNAYGSGITISSSLGCNVEDNVLIFCQNGVSMVGSRRTGGGPVRLAAQYGQDEAYYPKHNTFTGNLIVYPLSTDVFVRESEPTNPDWENRYIDNVSLSRADLVSTQFGKMMFENIASLNEAYTLASGQAAAHEMADLDAESRRRLDWAAGRLLDGVDRVAELGLSTQASATLEAVWQFPNRLSQGMWIQAGDQHILLIDVPMDEELSLVLDASASHPRIWTSRDPQWKAVATDMPVLTVSAQQGLVVMAGLGPNTRPAGGGLEMWAEQRGQRVSRLVRGEPYHWVVRVTNYDDEPVAASVIDFGGDRQTIAAGRSAIFRSAEQAVDGEDASSTVKVQFGENEPVQLSASASSDLQIVVSGVPSNYAGTDEAMYNAAPPTVVIDRKEQMVPEMYDLASGVGWNGLTDLSAAARLGWNPQGVWVFADVRDDQVVPAPRPQRPAFNGDAIELFYDARSNNLGQPNYAPGVLQIWVRAPEPGTSNWTLLEVERPESKSVEGMKAKGRLTAQGYQIEVFVPWSAFADGANMAHVGRVMGFDLAVNDGDDTSGKTGRRTQLLWKGTGNNFNDASKFGRIVLE